MQVVSLLVPPRREPPGLRIVSGGVVLSLRLCGCACFLQSKSMFQLPWLTQVQPILEIGGARQRRVPALIGLYRYVDRQSGTGLVQRQFCLRHAQKRFNACAGVKVRAPKQPGMGRSRRHQEQAQSPDSNLPSLVEKMK